MNYPLKIAGVLAEIIGRKTDEIYRLVKPAKKGIDADWAVNCFAFSRFMNNKKGPEIAEFLTDRIREMMEEKRAETLFLESVESAGPYLNFKINKAIMAADVIGGILEDISKYSREMVSESGRKSERVVIEYPSPNTNKPLHLGHVRNMLLGQTLSKMLEFAGDRVFQVNLLNDRGVHICKSMWAYKKWGEPFGKTPESEGRKSDHFVGDYYVMFAKEEARRKEKIKDILEELEKEKLKPEGERDENKIAELERKIEESEYGKLQREIKEMLKAWENNDPEVRALWRKMNDWAEKGFAETFELFGIKHDKVYYESEIYDKGKEIVLKGVEKGLFERLEDGAVIVRFKKKGLPKYKVLLRKDGTTLYITQDIYLAFKKMEDFNYDLSIYVIGNEQDMQLRAVFEILKMLGMKARNLHYSYGMVNLTTGKMKSREGTVVDADDLVADMKKLAEIEIEKRYPEISPEEKERRAFVIAMAAIRFFILKYEYAKDFLFDPQKSISFEGETGPYIIYAYARICSVFRKGTENGVIVPYNPETDSENPNFPEAEYGLLKDPAEIELIDHLYKYPGVLFSAVKDLKPHLIARYILELARLFNIFYHSCPILKAEPNLRDARLSLCEAVRKVLKHGLGLLSIGVLREM